jgi:peptide subunit release factor 1 (eRF1)
MHVAQLSQDTVRSLAGFQAGSVPVTTCYLDVDGRRLPTHRDIERELHQLVRAAGLNGNGHRELPASVRKDLQRMEQYVRGLDRKSTRGLAMFSCSDRGLWEVFELPVRVTSQLTIEPVPSVRQLEAVLEEYGPIGVLLTDRQRARLFVFQLGELVDHAELLDVLARHSDDDRGERLKTRQSNQLSEQYHQHVKRAAQLAFDIYQRTRFEHLVVGGPPEVRADLDGCLHPYLRERLAEEVQLPVTASEDQVRRAALDLEERIERRSEAALVAQLRDTLAAGGRAVAGLAPTLQAVCDHRVDRLFVAEGYEAEGWRCACGCLAPVGPRCPACSEKMERVPDVVELAIATVLANSGRVEVCIDNADLDVLGRIGALLRY